MLSQKSYKLRRDLASASEAIAMLNRELIGKMILLASQTGDVQPLIDAVQNMAKTSGLYSPSNTSTDHAQLQKALGDTLFKLAKAEDHVDALDHAIIAYRGAITTASMLGETDLRTAAKKNCALAINYRNSHGGPMSTSSAA